MAAAQGFGQQGLQGFGQGLQGLQAAIAVLPKLMPPLLPLTAQGPLGLSIIMPPKARLRYVLESRRLFCCLIAIVSVPVVQHRPSLQLIDASFASHFIHAWREF